MSKTQPLPLETIYEESGSFVASTGSIQHKYIDETINGLISSRSIPTVDIQRQRTNENHQKPPIEVRFRDGSKRYIHPSTTATMIINRRNLLNSSHENFSSKQISNSNNQQIFSSNFNKKNFQIKPPLLLTIITAEDLRQAGTISTSSSSSEGFETSTITSPIEKTQLLSIPNSKISNSSLRVMLTNDENEKNLSLNSNLTNKTVNHTVQPNTTILVEGRIRSAFRPFLKSVRFHPQTFSIKPRVASTNNRKLIIPTQQQEVVPYVQHNHKQNPLMSTTNGSYQPSTKRNNGVVQKSSYDSIIPTQMNFDVATNPFLIEMNPSIYQQQQQQSKSINNSLTLPPVLNLSPNSGQTFSFVVNPNMKWFNITSNSIYDIPHLSSKYSSIPLRITLPVVNSTYNQKLVIKHNIALEKRLLNAGLSPETVALYERILDIAENRQMINQYPYKTFI